MIALKEKKKTVKKVKAKKAQSPVKETYQLVKDDFTPEEATEIVNELFITKINFHKTKNFSHQIRFGSEIPRSAKRVNELMQSQKQAGKVIAKAKKSGKSLKISSTLTLELI